MTLIKKAVDIPVGDIMLEGMVGYKEKTKTAPGIIICHPHPQFGGSMNNNVVWALFEKFAVLGYVVLAFNFRGVGRSGGTYGEGKGEVDDVIGSVNWLTRFPQSSGTRLGLLGYSFGARVGLQAAAKEPRIQCCGAIAPPLAMFSFDSMDQYERPTFVVSGKKDTFCPFDQTSELLAKLQITIS